jgi:squalene-hopene/tetraprenyl-beta-curcumene cyclase
MTAPETSRPERLAAAARTVAEALCAELGPDGHWVGELSSSALSTATAVTALATADFQAHAHAIAAGLRWLAEHANEDGGWGDTVLSCSNISTTALCWAALAAGRAGPEYAETTARAEAWLARASGQAGATLDPAPLAHAIERRYGKDRTFSVPILMMCALSGRLGADGWRRVKPLPFELAAVPAQFYAAMKLPVVSYALPALIAIGQTIHHHAPTRNPLTRLARAVTKRRTLRLLEQIQPPNGGFLEATPLTSFVTMSLAAMGLREHPVTRRGVAFLKASMRADGSWPIDTNLSTWVSTLAIKALAHLPKPPLTWEQRSTLREWLLGQQYKQVHLYTRAAPGAWAWTDLPGGVPDADDTAGALLALLALGSVEPETRQAGLAGIWWLLDLQNSDGGVPTFCRGWGALPFDRSSPDLTAHALRAWSAWLPQLEGALKRRTEKAIARGLRFLRSSARADGSWLPLWFGNEHLPDDENPLYGTAQVLIALRDLRQRGFAIPDEMDRRAAEWLVAQQASEGGWGGAAGAPCSVEETALALEALAGTSHAGAVDRGAEWLMARVENGTWREPAPIGFYFAKLWYYERLYPQIFTAGALGKLAGLG